jgi:hypothetical protein
MLTVLLYAFGIGFVWALVTLANVRRDQLKIAAELALIARALGVRPGPPAPVILCDQCGALYPADKTGCTNCGRAKPKDAVPFVPTSVAAQATEEN